MSRMNFSACFRLRRSTQGILQASADWNQREIFREWNTRTPGTRLSYSGNSTR